jgi:putative ABC transport system permease protein
MRVDGRIRKIFGDLWTDRARSAMVFLAIAVGALGAGTVMDSRAILSREMRANYMSTNPASATLRTKGLSAADIEAASAVPGVGRVEAYDEFAARIRLGKEEEWRTLRLFALADYGAASIDRISPDDGAGPPGKGRILIERAAVSVLGGGAGSETEVSLGRGDENKLLVSGIVHAPGLAPAWMERLVYGWVSAETARSIGAETKNEYLRVTVSEKAMDKAHIVEVTLRLKAALESRGATVSHVEIPVPGAHPHQSQMMSLLYLLESFGILALILSGVLVAGAVSSLMARQLRQIGIMKAIGGSVGQISLMYYSLVLLLGGAASAMALPIAVVLARAYSAFTARILNFAIFDFSVPAGVYALQIAIGILVPAAAASPAIIRGSRITIREALAASGYTDAPRGRGRLDRAISAGAWRPLLLSLRNAFRKRGRFLLTVATLAVGGAVFMTSMNVSSSIDATVEKRYGSMRYDFVAFLTDPVRTEKLEAAVGSVPGIAAFESWGRVSCSRIFADGSQGNSFFLVAFPPDSSLQQKPVISRGRWIEPGDEDAIVLNQRVMADNPDIKIGDRIRLMTDSGESEWTLVGATTELMASFVGYAAKGRFDRVNGLEGMAKSLVVACDGRDPRRVASVAAGVERGLKNAGIGVSMLVKLDGSRKMAKEHFQVLASMLAFMALLVVVVGVLGLSSAMSVNVMERTREIGIMRSIGATPRAIGGMVMAESLIIGVSSWLLACIIAYPASRVIASRFGMIFFQTPLEFGLSSAGVFAWLLLATGAALLASVAPALNAAAIPVREAISFE